MMGDESECDIERRVMGDRDEIRGEIESMEECECECNDKRMRLREREAGQSVGMHAKDG